MANNRKKTREGYWLFFLSKYEKEKKELKKNILGEVNATISMSLDHWNCLIGGKY